MLLLAFAGRWLKQSSGLPFIAVAGVGAIVRWSLLSLDPPLPELYLVQITHAVTYACNLLGVMTYIQRHAPRRLAGSVQGIYAALASGIFAASAMAMSGKLYANYGAHAYLAMSAIAVVGPRGPRHRVAARTRVGPGDPLSGRQAGTRSARPRAARSTTSRERCQTRRFHSSVSG